MGKFVKGQSGNPKGRAVELLSKDLWKKHGPKALEMIVALARGAEEERVKLDASKYICDQAYGKASQSVELGTKDNAPFTAVINFGTPPKSE